MATVCQLTKRVGDKWEIVAKKADMAEAEEFAISEKHTPFVVKMTDTIDGQVGYFTNDPDTYKQYEAKGLNSYLVKYT